MSQYGLIYQLAWDTTDVVLGPGLAVPAKSIVVSIFDTEVVIPDDEDPEVIMLQPAGNPLTLSSVNNDQDKLFQVRSKQLVIRFLSDTLQGQMLSTFADGSDNRYYVEAVAGTDNFFKGFLMLSDMHQPFYPDPVVCELIASDHLGILKEIALTDETGANPMGKYRIAELLSFVLLKTGLSLSLNAINNVKHGTGIFSLPDAGFSSALNSFITTSDAFNYFYVGQEVIITGTSSNNGTWTVTASQGFGIGLIIVTIVGGTVVDEPAANPTFEDTSSGHLYDKIYLDAKTFEKEIGLSEDCYTVLQKILGEDSYITQWKGEWWIMRVDEMEDGVNYYAQFLSDGTFNGYFSPINAVRQIGDTKTIVHADAATDLGFNRPHLFARETYRYQNPLEIPCNIDFDRGTVITPPDLAAGSSTGVYSLECWDFLREGSPSIGSNIDQPAFAGSVGTLNKLFEFGYEKDKWLVIQTAGGFRHYFKSEGIPVQVGDKVDIGYQFRKAVDDATTNIFTAHIRLAGDDGFFYDWDYDQPSNVSFWQQKTDADIVFDNMWRSDVSGIDISLWQTINAESLPMPVSGTLYIRLLNTFASPDQVHFQNLSVEIRSFINGSYGRYDGHYNKVTRIPPTGYNANRDEQVYLGDSPRKTFKGAMFFLRTDGVYMLTVKFWSSAPFALGNPPDTSYYHPWGYLQAFAVYNQVRAGLRVFEASLYGLFTGESPDQWPDLMNKYLLTDTNDNTDNRVFMLVSFEQDYKTCKWTGTLIEVYNTVTGKISTDTFEFKYLTD